MQLKSKNESLSNVFNKSDKETRIKTKEQEGAPIRSFQQDRQVNLYATKKQDMALLEVFNKSDNKDHKLN